MTNAPSNIGVPDFIGNSREHHMAYAKNSGDFPKGASEYSLDKLERALGIKLPLAYLQFLKWAGNWRDGPNEGSDWLVDDIAANTTAFNEYRAANLKELDPRPDSGPIAIFCHGGYVWCWIYADEGDNPKVYCFDEGRGRQVTTFNVVDDWFLEGY